SRSARPSSGYGGSVRASTGGPPPADAGARGPCPIPLRGIGSRHQRRGAPRMTATHTGPGHDGDDRHDAHAGHALRGGHEAHGGHGAPTGHGDGGHDHAGQGGHHNHGDHAAVFRTRFWWSLLLTIPVVVTSEMVMDWFGYELDGVGWAGPVLGSVVFLWGGWPFLAGGWQEARDRRPGMMLLVAMAIVVAYAASMATTLGRFDLEFWWELAALVT